jgi:hypothetical protein
MRWSATRLRVPCLAVLSLAGGAYIVPSDVTPAQSRSRTPAEIIAFRFPGNGDTARPEPAATAATSVAQRVASIQTIDAEPSYMLASANARPVRVNLPSRSALPQAVPTEALAYAPATEADSRHRAPAAAAVERATAGPQPHERRAALEPAQRPAKQSPNVFTDAQIAAIKTKLKLSPQQQHYWPAVASALRNIDYARQAAGKSPSIDPNSPGVRQLKSAAFPLIMSFDAEQKSQVRQLARNMGLEEVAASF